jgi:hypothetical protein
MEVAPPSDLYTLRSTSTFMSADFLILLGLCILALIAHAAMRRPWLGWVVRMLIGLALLGEALALWTWLAFGLAHSLEFVSVALLALGTAAVLFERGRVAFSYVFTGLDTIASGQWIAAIKNHSLLKDCWKANRVFAPNSIPHLAGLWVYLTALWFLLGCIRPANFSLPEIPIPVPIALDQLFVYNGLGLVLLAACSVGIFVSRNPSVVLQRLGIVKPSGKQVLIGIGILAGSLFYDYLWSLLTHQLPGDLAGKLTHYNTAAFGSSVAGSAGSGAAAGGGAAVQGSLVLALATGLCAGIGEETLMRGALQPAFGIIPAGIIHGLAHGQFSQAPLFIVQVGLWSVLLGIVRRYTNTTTTMIGHVLYNFVLTFLFAFNP